MNGMQNTWIIFELNRQSFALPATYIREMLVLGRVDHLAQSPDHVRGVTTRRGSTVLAIDLRKWLELGSKLEEKQNLIQLLDGREQDHINWLSELKASVIEDREFKLTTDHHACAFGKWYDSFRTIHVSLRLQLEKFDNPHKKIHAIAIEVRKLLDGHHRDQALELINSTWNRELAMMRNLFAETRRIITEDSNEIIIITEKDNRLIGFIVDSVEGVSEIDPDNIEQYETCAANTELDNKRNDIYGIAKMDKGLCVLLNTFTLY